MSGLGNIVGLNNFVPSMALATAGGGVDFGEEVVSGASDGLGVDMQSSMAFAAEGDAFENGEQPDTLTVAERPAGSSRESLFAPSESHEMVAKKQGQKVSLPDSSRDADESAPSALQIDIAVPQILPSKKRLWHFYPLEGAGHRVYLKDKKGAYLYDDNGWVKHRTTDTGYWLLTMWWAGLGGMIAAPIISVAVFNTGLAGTVAVESGMWLFNKFCGNAVVHGGEWMRVLFPRSFISKQMKGATQALLKEELMGSVVGDDVGQRTYHDLQKQYIREWSEKNPVEQAVFLRADRIKANEKSDTPILLCQSRSPVSVGFLMCRFIEQMYGMGGIAQDVISRKPSSTIDDWHAQYKNMLDNESQRQVKFSTEDTHVPEMVIGAKLAAIPAARRALMGVSKKQYRRMLGRIIGEWARFNPISCGVFHAVDHQMNVVPETDPVMVSSHWLGMSPGFVLMRLIERLGIEDVVTTGDANDPAVWHAAYTKMGMAKLQKRALTISVNKDADGNDAIALGLMREPRIRAALMHFSKAEYRGMIKKIVGEWNGVNLFSRRRHVKTDIGQGLLPPDSDGNAISPGFIARRFCERYLGMGEKGTREQFKFDAEVRNKLEAWYRSYMRALEGGAG